MRRQVRAWGEMKMQALLLLTCVVLAIGLSLWLPAYRLKRVLQRPFPAHFSAILAQNIAVYRNMPADLQQQLQFLIKQFLYEKKFVGCADLSINDEIRVTIAGQACLLLLNKTPRIYPSLSHILVYPSAFIAPRSEIGLGGIVTHADRSMAGESWSDGRVILAWDHVQHGGHNFYDGHNVVLHEFAHQLDSETGQTNGAPLLPSQAGYQRWSAVLSQEFERLQEAAQFQNESLMDHYGATNPAEFFAVATETFYAKPHQMAQWHPALFEEFRKYYRVDPREWCAKDYFVNH